VLPRHLLGMALLAGSLGIGPPAAAATTTVGGERLASSGLVVDAPGAEALPDVGAAAWLLADLDSGDVLAARDPHGRYRPASTMKILTALTLLPDLDPDATYVAQQQDANAEGSKVGVVPGAIYTVHNLYEALFLVSGNDAALALANAAGGLDATVARMNAVARRLGALDTRAANPSGSTRQGSERRPTTWR
jgi:D-alanyl-D-alanine carboxypeptidase (penicillin-binding protein 5/6)